LVINYKQYIKAWGRRKCFEGEIKRMFICLGVLGGAKNERLWRSCRMVGMQGKKAKKWYGEQKQVITLYFTLTLYTPPSTHKSRKKRRRRGKAAFGN
jgi:hypothetical protein